MIEIRPIRTFEEYRDVERLQREVWNIKDDIEIVPHHVLLTANTNGGLVMGAFDAKQGKEDLVGFVFGFVGLLPDGQPKHCSHMAGVVSLHQNNDIGYQLKVAQREYVMSQGIELIAWTFDPLQSRNAYFNFHKLGATCKTYLRDLYGSLRDEASSGLPSDRFQVEWRICTAHVVNRLDGNTPDLTLENLREQGALFLDGQLHQDVLGPPSGIPSLAKDRILAQIPAQFESCGSTDLMLARSWYEYSCSLFERAFAEGYTIVDFVFEQGQSYYLLEKKRQFYED